MINFTYVEYVYRVAVSHSRYRHSDNFAIYF